MLVSMSSKQKGFFAKREAHISSQTENHFLNQYQTDPSLSMAPHLSQNAPKQKNTGAKKVSDKDNLYG